MTTRTLAAFALASTSLALAQPPPLWRPNDTTVMLRASGIVSQATGAAIIVPSATPNQAPAVFPASATATGEVIQITFPQSVAAQIRENSQVHALLYIQSIAFTDPKTPAVRDSTSTIPDTYTFKAGSASGKLATFQVLYAPEPNLLKDLSKYKVTPANLSVAAANLVDTASPMELGIILNQAPGDGVTAKVTFSPDGKANVAIGDIAGPSVAKPTSASPSGGNDIYAALSFTRNGLTQAGMPADVFGINTTLTHNWLLGHTSDSLSWYFDPNFTAKVYSKGQDSENTMTLSTPLQLWVQTSSSLRPVLDWIILSAAPTYETDEKQHNRNIVADLEFMPFPETLYVLSKKHTRLRFTPFAGAELGDTIHNDLSQLNGSSVERFKAGSGAELKFYVKDLKNAAVTITANYTYRHLFEPEILMTTKTVTLPAGTFTSSSGNTTQLPGGTLSEQIFVSENASPRRYLDLTLSGALTVNLAAQIEYSRGELPPAYQRVDKLQAGLTFLFSFKK